MPSVPTSFSLGPLTFHLYGIILSIALIIGLVIVFRRARLYKIDPADIERCFVFTIIATMLGARLWHIGTAVDYYTSNPQDILKVWNGGMALHGGLLGGATVIILYALIRKLDFWKGFDLVVPALALGQAIGRWANFFNQELYGRPTDSPLGIYISPQNRLTGYEQFERFHPTFLYESVLDFLNFLILLLLERHWKAKYPGRLALVYAVNYSLIRIIVEWLRVDSIHVFGVKLPILVSSIVIVICLGLLLWRNKSLMKQNRTMPSK